MPTSIGKPGKGAPYKAFNGGELTGTSFDCESSQHGGQLGWHVSLLLASLTILGILLVPFKDVPVAVLPSGPADVAAAWGGGVIGEPVVAALSRNGDCAVVGGPAGVKSPG